MNRNEKSTIGRTVNSGHSGADPAATGASSAPLETPADGTGASKPLPRARALPRELRWLAGALDLADRVVPPLAERWAARQFFTPRRPRLGDRSALESARRIGIAGRELGAWRWGDGAPVVLVHGWEGHAAQLGAFVEPLLARGLSPVAFDAPAHGSSSGDYVTLFDFADAVADVARSIGPVQGVIAHSFGALATLSALHDGKLDVPSVVLIAPPSPRGRMAAVSAGLGLRPDFSRRVQHRIETAAGRTLADVEATALACELQTPGLVVHDRRDAMVPFGGAEALVNAWPDATLHATDGLGHMRILSDPGVTRVAAAFVATHRRWPPESPDLSRALDFSKLVA